MSTIGVGLQYCKSVDIAEWSHRSKVNNILEDSCSEGEVSVGDLGMSGGRGSGRGRQLHASSIAEIRLISTTTDQWDEESDVDKMIYPLTSHTVCTERERERVRIIHNSDICCLQQLVPENKYYHKFHDLRPLSFTKTTVRRTTCI